MTAMDRVEHMSPTRWGLFCAGCFIFATAVVWMLLSPPRENPTDVWVPRTVAEPVETGEP